jgi:hypothetical protein
VTVGKPLLEAVVALAVGALLLAVVLVAGIVVAVVAAALLAVAVAAGAALVGVSCGSGLLNSAQAVNSHSDEMPAASKPKWTNLRTFCLMCANPFSD